MKNFSKKSTAFFATCAFAFTMGTAITTTSAEAHCYSSCTTLKYYESKYKSLSDYYKNLNPWLSNIYSSKASYWRTLYTSRCQVTPPPAKTGTLCGYVFIEGTAEKTDGMPVTVTQSDGTLVRTLVNAQGKWSLEVKAGTATVFLDEAHVHLEDGAHLEQVYGENSSTATVISDKLNDGGIDNYNIVQP